MNRGKDKNDIFKHAKQQIQKQIMYRQSVNSDDIFPWIMISESQATEVNIIKLGLETIKPDKNCLRIVVTYSK